MLGSDSEKPASETLPGYFIAYNFGTRWTTVRYKSWRLVLKDKARVFKIDSYPMSDQVSLMNKCLH